MPRDARSATSPLRGLPKPQAHLPRPRALLRGVQRPARGREDAGSRDGHRDRAFEGLAMRPHAVLASLQAPSLSSFALEVVERRCAAPGILEKPSEKSSSSVCSGSSSRTTEPRYSRGRFSMGGPELKCTATLASPSQKEDASA